MKTAKFDVPSGFHPEVIADNLLNQELIDYLVENHPHFEKIIVLGSDQVDDDRRTDRFKYIVTVPLTKAMRKVLRSDFDEITGGMFIDIKLDKKALTSNVKIIPELLTSAAKVSSSSTFSQNKDKWTQHVEVKVGIKAFGIGGMIEKHLLEIISDMLKKEFELIDEFLEKQQK